MESFVFDPAAMQDESSYLSGSFTDTNGELINYWPAEVSSYKISFYSPFHLSNGNQVFLSLINGKKLNLEVESVTRIQGHTYPLVKLRLLDESIALESNLNQILELRGWTVNTLKADNHLIPSGHRALRAIRFESLSPICIRAKTFGSKDSFKLSTRDVSKSGMLLENSSKFDIVPFSLNTIIEISIDPEQNFLDEPVECLAKVVRCETSSSANNNSSSFGIKLIEMTPEQVDAWGKYVEYQEKLELSNHETAA